MLPGLALLRHVVLPGLALLALSTSMNFPISSNISHVRHIATATPDQFDQHTAASFWNSADKIRDAYVAGNKTEGDRLQQALGIKYNPDGLIFDPECRKIYSPIDNSYFDWVHCIVASGGMAQYEVNGFINACVKSRIPVSAIDVFQRKITAPKSLQSLSSNFFANRTTSTPHGCMKAFASECITAVTVCCFLVDMLLEPQKLLPQHCECMKMLGDMLDIFMLGDDAYRHIDALEKLVEEHHLKFVELYGSECAKVKPHLVYHIVQKIRKFRKAMGCLGPERKHRLPKAVGRNCKTPNHLNLHVIKRAVNQICEELKGYSFAPMQLKREVEAPELKDSFGSGYDVFSVHVSKSARTPFGNVHVDDMIVVRSSGGLLLCKAYFFMKTTSLGSFQHSFFAHVQVYEQFDQLLWKPSANVLTTPLGTVVASVFFTPSAGGIRTLKLQYLHEAFN